jgi:hypothetical protein
VAILCPRAEAAASAGGLDKRRKKMFTRRARGETTASEMVAIKSNGAEVGNGGEAHAHERFRAANRTHAVKIVLELKSAAGS